MKFYSHYLYFAPDFDKNSVQNVSTVCPHSASSFMKIGTVIVVLPLGAEVILSHYFYIYCPIYDICTQCC